MGVQVVQIGGAPCLPAGYRRPSGSASRLAQGAGEAGVGAWVLRGVQSSWPRGCIIMPPQTSQRWSAAMQQGPSRQRSTAYCTCMCSTPTVPPRPRPTQPAAPARADPLEMQHASWPRGRTSFPARLAINAPRCWASEHSTYVRHHTVSVGKSVCLVFIIRLPTSCASSNASATSAMALAVDDVVPSVPACSASGRLDHDASRCCVR